VHQVIDHSQIGESHKESKTRYVILGIQTNAQTQRQKYFIHRFNLLAEIPKLYFVGTDNTNEDKPFHVMIMDILGPSLEDVFSKCKRQFDLKTVLLLSL
jgi:hypothetical protein